MPSRIDQHRKHVELQADLRILHAKVGELFAITQQLKKRVDPDELLATADSGQLAKNIDCMDEVYRWFTSIKGSLRPDTHR